MLEWNVSSQWLPSEGFKVCRISGILVRAPESFINRTLWPEYLEISRALDEYLRDATERIIREEVFGDADEAEEQPEAPAGLLAPGEPAPGFAD